LSPAKLVPDNAPQITQKWDEPIPEIQPEVTPNNEELPTELRETFTPQLNLQNDL
jgi:L-rhamnose mutarotase